MNVFERQTINKILSLKRESRDTEADDLQEWFSDAKEIRNVIENDDLRAYKKLQKIHGINFVGYEDQTPIDLAARYGSLGIFKFLVKKGAKYNLEELTNIAAYYGEAPMGHVNERWVEIMNIAEESK